jgi:hypothetical protein
MLKLNAKLTPLVGMNLFNTELNRIARLGLLLFACTTLNGCATTVGQEFRDIMADIDAQCRRDHQGPYYDNTIPNNTQHGDCDILSIKPADPLATEEGRFAYSIKLPPPHDKLKTQYSRWMTAGSYFKELCEQDAGEWIFKTVDGVAGVMAVRAYSNMYSQNLAALLSYDELPMNTSEPQNDLVQPPVGGYQFLEVPTQSTAIGEQASYLRYSRSSEPTSEKPYRYLKKGSYKTWSVPYIVESQKVSLPISRYAYVQRGIKLPDALENGIKGQELILIDRTTGEVLAFRRRFGRYFFESSSGFGRHYLSQEACKPNPYKNDALFIQKVIRPSS